MQKRNQWHIFFFVFFLYVLSIDFKNSWYRLVKEWDTLWSCSARVLSSMNQTDKWRFYIVFSRIKDNVKKLFKKQNSLCKIWNQPIGPWTLLSRKNNDIFVVKNIVSWDFRSHYMFDLRSSDQKKAVNWCFSSCCE